MKEPGTSDEEDVEDGLLNASMTSSYSHLSIDEANATMKPFGLSNTLPSVSPRDKRRQKESEVCPSFRNILPEGIYFWRTTIMMMFFVSMFDSNSSLKLK